MEDTKKTVLAGNGEKDIPRAVYDGVLTIDVDAQVESMEEQEEARWHQLLNAHRTRKICPGQRYGLGVDGRCRRKIPGRRSGAGHGQ